MCPPCSMHPFTRLIKLVLYLAGWTLSLPALVHCMYEADINQLILLTLIIVLHTELLNIPSQCQIGKLCPSNVA